MKYFYKLLLALLLLPNLMLAQNLVPNPSFEDTVACPTSTGDMNAVTSWYSAKGSPDYFHPCANTNTFYLGVPNNFGGNQMPLDGDAYTGVTTYKTGYPHVREYLGVELLQPLQIGVEYFVSVYISKGDAAFGGEIVDCATNKFGFKFTTVKYAESLFNPALTDNFSHIYSNTIITDSTNWVQISGSFLADSMYKYLNIGNFYDASNTSINTCSGVAYYYVDKVCVSTNSLTCDVIVGFSSLQSSPIKLYPNPASSLLKIANLLGTNNYLIINATGYVVKKGTISEVENLIDVTSLPNGMYFIRINNSHKQKFIISH